MSANRAATRRPVRFRKSDSRRTPRTFPFRRGKPPRRPRPGVPRRRRLILNEAAREVAETGINIDAARMILTVFSRIRSIDEIPPVMRKEFERIGMDRAVMNELLGLSLAARSCAAFDFSQLRTLKPQTGHVLYRTMQKVQEAPVPAEE